MSNEISEAVRLFAKNERRRKKLLMMPENLLYGEGTPCNVKGFRFTILEIATVFVVGWHAKNFAILGDFFKEKPSRMSIAFWYNYKKYIIPSTEFKDLLGFCKNPELLAFV